MKSSILKAILILGVMSACVLTELARRLIMRTPSNFTSLCIHCGLVEKTKEWHLPGAQFAIYKQRTQFITPVSESLRTNNLVGAHGHNWKYSIEDEIVFSCGSTVTPGFTSTVESESIALLINELVRLGEQEFRQKLLANLFKIGSPYMVKALVVPDEGFRDAEHLNDWIRHYSEPFDREVEEWTFNSH